MRGTGPVLTSQLFPKLLHSLIDVLEDLTPEEWALPTTCPRWSVHDLTAHILGDEVWQLSMGRDGFHPSMITADEWDDLVVELNDLNEQWVRAMTRVSPRLMIDLLRSTGEQVNRYLQSCDPHAVGPSVSWASPDPAPMWLHIAREYTERWHHQQQVRQAVGRPILTDPDWFAPVLATFVHGLRRTYSSVRAPNGTMVRVTISGASGGTCLVARTDSDWVLCEDEDADCVAAVTIDEIDAWQLFTKSVARELVEPRIVIEGYRDLGSKVLETVSIIA